MKKSRIAKFALLGASAAALAATLSTSTYAWYVSNATATVAAIDASTNSAASDGSVSISETGAKGTYYPQITLTSGTGYTATSLSPVITANGTAFTEMDGTTSATSSVIAYTFYIMADKAMVVTPTITVTHKAETVPSQVNYSTAQTSPITTSNGTVANGQSFYLDAAQALYMSQSTTAGTSMATAENGTAWASAGGATTTQASSVVSGSNITYSGTNLVAPAGAVLAAGGAVDYYEEIMDATLTGAQATPYVTSNNIGNITLAAMTPVKVVYYLWLDGADDQCFNCCAGQNFTVAFSYTKA